MVENFWVIRNNGMDGETAGVFQVCVIADELGNIADVLGDTLKAKGMRAERDEGMMRWLTDVQVGWIGMFSEMKLEDSIPPEAIGTTGPS